MFQELAASLIRAGVIAFAAQKLRQPLIIGCIITGILVEPDRAVVLIVDDLKGLQPQD